ncbi:MAG: hypothetical protein JXB38_05175 [Anaerolineales bacterium]|nr:hypothetical protein [Anaerolineales bacterium]
MKFRRYLLVLLIILLLCIPVGIVQAQDDDPQPLNDEFVEALVMMTVDYNLMAGKDELADLNALHDFVDEYYTQRINTVSNNNTVDAESNAALLQQQKDKLLTTIRQDISQKKGGFRWVINFLDLFFRPDRLEAATPPDTIQKVVSGSDDPPADYLTTINTRTLTNLKAQANLALDIQIISVQPALAPALDDQSPWSYDLPSFGDSSAPISPSTDDDSSPAGTAPDEPPSGARIEEPILKPLRFDNNGFDAVTVKVETYTPAEGYSPTKPTASTVVFPEGNPSARLELPLGTYTFCYEWELDEDYNNDDYIDYHHKTTRATTLNVNSSDNPESAISVILSPDSNVSNPNGKCGETVLETNGHLTPEEAANAGTHTYTSTCQGVVFTVSCNDDSPETVTLTTEFTQTGVVITGSEGEADVFSHTGVNQYAATEDTSAYTITFTPDGLLSTWVDAEWGTNATIIATRK